ncbi:hypothetical protein [Burkholderia sp. Z1]|uniref:hypothetical protein n=1 Tax=Burkholderia sp. Z1 TaxID=2759039 RepID=UPI00186633FD|nr:hypothetical protein [Burkholderia sp. Z1]
MGDSNTIGGNRATPMNVERALERGDGPAPASSPAERADRGNRPSPLLDGLRHVQPKLDAGRHAFAPAGTTVSVGAASWQQSVGPRTRINDPRTDCPPGAPRDVPDGAPTFTHPEAVTSRAFLERTAQLQSAEEPTMPGAWPGLRPEWDLAVTHPSTPSHAAKAWVQQQIGALGQPEQLIRGYFRTSVTAPPARRDDARSASRRSEPEPANAPRQLTAFIQALPFEHRWDVTRVLADVSGGSPRLAVQIARRLQQPLQLHADGHGDDAQASTDPAVERLAWQAARQLVGTADHPGGVALDALLGLQGLRDEDDGNVGKAGALVVFLRATARLAVIQPGFSSVPGDAMNPDHWGELAGNPQASLALDALRALGSMEIVAKAQPGPAAAVQVTHESQDPRGMRVAVIDHEDYTVRIRATRSQLAAVVALLWSHDERGPGTPFTDGGALAYRRLTRSVEASAGRPPSDTWSAWAHDGMSFVKDTFGRLQGGPLAAVARKLVSPFQAPESTPAVASPREQALGPGGAIYRTMPGMLGQDLDTSDKQRAAYDGHVIATRDAVLAYCEQRIAHANDPGELASLALIAEQLTAWQDTRALDLPGTRPQVAQSPRPESFRVDAETAGQLWQRARERVQQDAGGAAPNVKAAALRHFDENPNRKAEFVSQLTTAPVPFGREALQRWIDLSGASRHAEDDTLQWHGRLEQARRIADDGRTLPLERIDSESLERQWSALVDRTEPGTQYRAMTGGTAGVQLSVALGVVPVAVAVTGLQSNTSGYAVGAENNGFAIRFEDERVRTVAGGASGYGGVALAGGLVGIGGSGGGALRGSSTQTRGVLFRAAVPRRAFGHDPAALEQWREDGKDMVVTMFRVAGEVDAGSGDPDDYADAFAAACIGKPSIQMASRSANAANLVAVGSGSVNARLTPAGAGIQPGVFGSVAGTATLVDHALSVEQGAAVASSSTFRSATSVSTNVAAGLQMPTLSAGGHDPAAQRLAALTVADAGVTDALLTSKVSSTYLARDNRGPIASLMVRDTFYHDFRGWREAVEQNPTWQQGIGPERLAQYIAQAAVEYDGATSLGERWIFRPDTTGFAVYTVHERMVETLKQEVAATADPHRKAQAQDRLLAASDAMQDFLNDPAMLAPVGLFGIRQTQATKTIGSGYVLVAKESHTQTAVQLTNFEPYVETRTTDRHE